MKEESEFEKRELISENDLESLYAGWGKFLRQGIEELTQKPNSSSVDEEKSNAEEKLI